MSETGGSRSTGEILKNHNAKLKFNKISDGLSRERIEAIEQGLEAAQDLLEKGSKKTKKQSMTTKVFMLIILHIKPGTVKQLLLASSQALGIRER